MDSIFQIGRRIAVVGAGGKTTLAAELSIRLGVPHVELDALFWEPNWVQAETDVFRQRVAEATSGDAWVVEGNHTRARDLVWPRAETIIWLDYSLRLVVWRTFRRSLRRIRSRENLWNSGNNETVRNTFFSTESLLLWHLRNLRRRRRKYDVLLAPHGTKSVRLRSPKELRVWRNFQKL